MASKKDVLKDIKDALRTLSVVDAGVHSEECVSAAMDQAYHALSSAMDLILWGEVEYE